MTTVYCFHCHTQNILETKVPFRAQCAKCSFDLHICKNCKYYSKGKPNDCLVPGTEPVSDREKYNFCEEFSPADKTVNREYKKTSDIEKKLFGNHSNSKKTDFDSLFPD